MIFSLSTPLFFIWYICLSLSLSELHQVLQNMLNHSNKQLALVKAEPCSQQSCERGVAETNGGGARMGGAGSGSPSSPLTAPPESQSPLHFLADLAEQKSREEKKGEVFSHQSAVHDTPKATLTSASARV